MMNLATLVAITILTALTLSLRAWLLEEEGNSNQLLPKSPDRLSRRDNLNQISNPKQPSQLLRRNKSNHQLNKNTIEHLTSQQRRVLWQAKRTSQWMNWLT
jgi:hypothetical protein